MVSPLLDTEPIKLSVTMKVSRDFYKVRARFRPHPSRGRPDRSGPSVVLWVEPPEDIDRTFWNWNIGQASNVLTLVEVPDDYYELESPDRYKLLMGRIHEIGIGKPVHSRRYR